MRSSLPAITARVGRLAAKVGDELGGGCSTCRQPVYRYFWGVVPAEAPRSWACACGGRGTFQTVVFRWAEASTELGQASRA